jgi:hypothetical protein
MPSRMFGLVDEERRALPATVSRAASLQTLTRVPTRPELSALRATRVTQIL